MFYKPTSNPQLFFKCRPIYIQIQRIDAEADRLIDEISKQKKSMSDHERMSNNQLMRQKSEVEKMKYELNELLKHGHVAEKFKRKHLRKERAFNEDQDMEHEFRPIDIPYYLMEGKHSTVHKLNLKFGRL